jgi:hypothetical protein
MRVKIEILSQLEALETSSHYRTTGDSLDV